MNRFVLDEDPVAAAQMHCDKHVVKMILEEAQMLSTAHRVIDHFAILTHRPDGKRSRTEWVLRDNALDGLLYRSTHVNHPCSAWVRASSANYDWARRLLRALSDEYTYRYGREHAVRRSGLEAALSMREYAVLRVAEHLDEVLEALDVVEHEGGAAALGELGDGPLEVQPADGRGHHRQDRKSTRLNSSHRT